MYVYMYTGQDIGQLRVACEASIDEEQNEVARRLKVGAAKRKQGSSYSNWQG